MARWIGPQATARDLYPNLDGYTMIDTTNPEVEEMDHYVAGPASAAVETPEGVVIPAKKTDVWGFVGVAVVIVLVLWFIGKA